MSTPTARNGISVTPAASGRDMRAFLRLPWQIYAGDSVWVPPLLQDVKTLLNRDKHPFHEHADVEYFLARRDGRVVGRIAAIINHLHNDFHGDKVGFFGFFECEDNADTAHALLATAEDWVAEHGMTTIRGPANFSSNEELGLLVDGFDDPPQIMMTYNPRYYEGLIEGAGYAKSKDLLAYTMYGMEPPPRLVRGVERIAVRKGISVRPLDMKRFDDEVALLKDIYNSAWEQNWGFVPMTDGEFQLMAKQLKPVVNPKLVLFAEVKGEPAGFAIGLPDFNQALQHINGRLLPFGLFKVLWYQRSISRVRIITLGLKPGFRRTGLDALLYLRLWKEGVAAGYPEGEGSWILEDNWEMRHGLEHLGARVYKTYRLYDKSLGDE